MYRWFFYYYISFLYFNSIKSPRLSPLAPNVQLLHQKNLVGFLMLSLAIQTSVLTLPQLTWKKRNMCWYFTIIIITIHVWGWKYIWFLIFTTSAFKRTLKRHADKNEWLILIWQRSAFKLPSTWYNAILEWRNHMPWFHFWASCS